MKKNLILNSVLALGIAGLLFTGCSDDDTTGPVITLIGDNPMIISLNTTSVSDPSATAEDDEDGTVTVNSDWTATNPNLNLKGTYTITYTALDAAGNESTETRTVNVINDAEFLGGSYVNAYDTCQSGTAGTFNATITASNTINNAITINNFGGFGTTVNINGTRSGNSISFAGSQSLGAVSSLLSGNGTITSSSPVNFSVAYTWTDGSSTEICTSTYTK